MKCQTSKVSTNIVYNLKTTKNYLVQKKENYTLQGTKQNKTSNNNYCS